MSRYGITKIARAVILIGFGASNPHGIRIEPGAVVPNVLCSWYTYMYPSLLVLAY